LSIKIVIHRSVDSLHLHTTKAMYLIWYLNTGLQISNLLKTIIDFGHLGQYHIFIYIIKGKFKLSNHITRIKL